MKLEIENGMLGIVTDVLYKLQLNGIQSVHRTKLINILHKRVEEVNHDLQELLKEHAKKDEKGEPIVHDMDGQESYTVADRQKYEEDKAKIFKDKFVIEGTNHQTMLKSVRDAIYDCPIPWEGVEADGYACLYLQFEEQDTNKEDEK